MRAKKRNFAPLSLVPESPDDTPTVGTFGVFHREEPDGRRALFAYDARGTRIAALTVTEAQMEGVSRALWDLVDATDSAPALTIVR